MLSIICAMGLNNAIGIGNKLPWHLPDDLKRFKKITMGHALIMGRKTHESIGRPLPGRRNIVLSRQPSYSAPGCEVFPSLESAVRAASENDNEIFVIGGAELYRQTINSAERLYLTIVEDSPQNADAFFPDFSRFKKELSREPAVTNGYRVTYLVLEK